MTNREKLKGLLIDVFLLDESEFRFDLRREDIGTWDSLGTVSLAVGLQDVFGHHLSPAEATSLASVEDIVAILRSKGVDFPDA
jgi:acyl carrier protein